LKKLHYSQKDLEIGWELPGNRLWKLVWRIEAIWDGCLSFSSKLFGITMEMLILRFISVTALELKRFEKPECCCSSSVRWDSDGIEGRFLSLQLPLPNLPNIPPDYEIFSVTKEPEVAGWEVRRATSMRNSRQFCFDTKLLDCVTVMA
jgi:hypothetical protein